MKEKELPNFFERRKILFSDNMPSEKIDAYGDMFLEAGRVNEALDFYEKSGNSEKARAVLARAEEQGDVGVWMRAKLLLKENPQPDEWEKMAQRAVAAGKREYAIFAFERAGKTEQAEELKQKLAHPGKETQ